MRLYADASALVKLLVAEPESAALARAIPANAEVVSSAVSVVEVARAVRVAELDDEAEPDAAGLLAGCTLVDVDGPILYAAAALVSSELRTLDAIHLATAVAVGPDAVLVYDRRLANGAAGAGLQVEAPGAS